METASGCPVQALGHMPARPLRGPHGGWQKQEIELLQKRIGEAAQSGESLRSVFERIASELGRKPNSIRNFYYAQIRPQDEDAGARTLPFETFSPDEVEQLVASVLTARAQGLSVRACVRQLAGGDRTRMLRYQNKYRSTVRTRPQLVRQVMDRLSGEGIAFVSPYAAESFEAESQLPCLKKRAQQAGDEELTQLFDSLEHLLDLALHPHPPCDTGESEAQKKADRLSVRCDMLRIELDDQHAKHAALRTQTEGMVTLIKEFIALPEDERAAQSAAFCRTAAQRLSAVECALMQPQM